MWLIFLFIQYHIASIFLSCFEFVPFMSVLFSITPFYYCCILEIIVGKRPRESLRCKSGANARGNASDPQRHHIMVGGQTKERATIRTELHLYCTQSHLYSPLIGLLHPRLSSGKPSISRRCVSDSGGEGGDAGRRRRLAQHSTP